MTKDEEPKITSSSKDDFTRVTFKPDLAKFKMTELDDDIVGLMYRRAYDIAGSTRGVKVFLNNKQIPVCYLKYFLGSVHLATNAISSSYSNNICLTVNFLRFINDLHMLSMMLNFSMA